MIIPARTKDLGGFTVGRVLPYVSHKMVGPFIFFDHMGPAEFSGEHGMDVRPHPHINLATVTYLFDGKIRHRDSLGSDAMIEPGAINWMTAGRGIVHSERTPHDDPSKTNTLHGIQLWVALPEEFEECDPSFEHHTKLSLPEFEINGVKIKLLLGKLFGYESPVRVHSDLFYAELILPKGARLPVSTNNREAGFYVVGGHIEVDHIQARPSEMYVNEYNRDILDLIALEDSRVMLIGGSSVGPRFIDWNFVSSSKERIEEVKKMWQDGGPKPGHARFPTIPGDDKEYIPLK